MLSLSHNHLDYHDAQLMMTIIIGVDLKERLASIASRVADIGLPKYTPWEGLNIVWYAYSNCVYLTLH